MQLLYGNDGTNYHTIAKSKEITENLERKLLEGYLNYSFVRETEKYSSIAFEPVSITYVTTNLGGLLENDKIILSKAARMTNYATPCYYAHFHLFDMNEERYGKDFFDLLQYTFIKDTELNEYKEKGLDNFIQEKENLIIDREALEKETLLPIIASLLHVADRASKQVKLILDVEGDGYNQRALDVMGTIYSYLPYNVRQKVGFSTYATADASISSRVKLQLYTREALGRLGDEAIDLANVDSNKILNLIPEEIINLARDFVEANEKIRAEWFEGFGRIFGLKKTSVKELGEYHRNIRKWENEDIKKIIDSITEYAYKGVIQREESIVFPIFSKIMNCRFKEQDLIKWYQNKIKDILQKQKSFKFTNQMRGYICLGEVVNDIQFHIPMFLDWEENVIIREGEFLYEDSELKEYFNEKKKELYRIQSLGDKHETVVVAMRQKLENRIKELERDIAERLRKEKENISQFFDNWNMFEADLEEVGSQRTKIKYGENIDFWHKKLVEKLKKNLEDIKYIQDYKTYIEYKERVTKYSEYLMDSEQNDIMDMLEKKAEIVEALEKKKYIKWECRDDILKTYAEIEKTRENVLNKDIIIPDYVIKISEREYSIEGKRLEPLIKYIFCCDEESNKLPSVFYDDKELVQDLMTIGALRGEHYELLVSEGIGDRKKLLDYYLNSRFLLSKKAVEICIRNVDRQYSSYDIETDNIVALIVAEKKRECGNNDKKNKVDGENILPTDANKNSIENEDNRVKRKCIIDSETVIVGGIIFGVILILYIVSHTFIDGGIMIPIILSGVILGLILIAGIVGTLMIQEGGIISIGIIIGGILSALLIWLLWFYF